MNVPTFFRIPSLTRIAALTPVVSLALLATLAAPAARAQTTATTTVNANDVVINGESFFATSNIRDELNRLARADGVIGSTESFRQVAVSGALISQILGYYRNANPKPVYVISDGGGNDLMGNCPGNVDTCPVVANTFATVKAYFDTMAVHGTKKVLWMRYPDPQGAQWATLKANQDLFNPLVKSLCDTIRAPRCVWVDLRPVWEGHYAEYTTDGIHATNAGGTATAEAFWKVIVDSNFFDLTPTSLRTLRTVREEDFVNIQVRVGVEGRARLSVEVATSGAHTVSLHQASGRLLARRQGSGVSRYGFATGVRTGQFIVRVRTDRHERVHTVFVGASPH